MAREALVTFLFSCRRWHDSCVWAWTMSLVSHSVRGVRFRVCCFGLGSSVSAGLGTVFDPLMKKPAFKPMVPSADVNLTLGEALLLFDERLATSGWEDLDESMSRLPGCHF